jgi:hypothetical protein
LIPDRAGGPLVQPALLEAHNLLCRVRLTLRTMGGRGNGMRAGREASIAQNSDFHLWLGRALGEKADRASFLNAYSLAKRDPRRV